jgi:hypothetical protein
MDVARGKLHRWQLQPLAESTLEGHVGLSHDSWKGWLKGAGASLGTMTLPHGMRCARKNVGKDGILEATVDSSAVQSLANAVFIGYMMGCQSFFGRRTQVMVNFIGELVGHEILKYIGSQGIVMDSLSDVEFFLRDSELAGFVSLVEEAEEIIATIEECGICPKRVGHHRFDGTACPWPGVLSGVLSGAFRQTLETSASLVPAERCTISQSREKHKVS